MDYSFFSKLPSQIEDCGAFRIFDASSAKKATVELKIADSKFIQFAKGPSGDPVLINIQNGEILIGSHDKFDYEKGLDLSTLIKISDGFDDFIYRVTNEKNLDEDKLVKYDWRQAKDSISQTMSLSIVKASLMNTNRVVGFIRRHLGLSILLVLLLFGLIANLLNK
jgi:hypothetical protein